MNKKKRKPFPQQPQPQQLNVEQALFQLGSQLDNIKALYNNIILQQDQKLRELMQKKEEK